MWDKSSPRVLWQHWVGSRLRTLLCPKIGQIPWANNMMQKHCPYSTRLLTACETVNQEHILPMALGAPQSFCVWADAGKNSKMNDLIDSPVCNDSLMRLIATSQGVVSRSGPVKVELIGIEATTGNEVRSTLSKDGAGFRFSKPVDVDPASGVVKGVRGFGDAAVQLAQQIKRNYERKHKGACVELGEAINHQQPWIKHELELDLNLLRQELVKIAYLMTVRVFGDQAILSSSGALYRAAMFANDATAMKATGIKGSAYNSMPPGFPKPRSGQHALTCFRLGDNIMTGVTLFGMFNAFFVTPAADFTVDDAHGELVIIDAAASKLTSMPYVEALPRIFTGTI